MFARGAGSAAFLQLSRHTDLVFGLIQNHIEVFRYAALRIRMCAPFKISTADRRSQLNYVSLLKRHLFHLGKQDYIRLNDEIPVGIITHAIMSPLLRDPLAQTIEDFNFLSHLFIPLIATRPREKPPQYLRRLPRVRLSRL